MKVNGREEEEGSEANAQAAGCKRSRVFASSPLCVSQLVS